MVKAFAIVKSTKTANNYDPGPGVINVCQHITYLFFKCNPFTMRCSPSTNLQERKSFIFKKKHKMNVIVDHKLQ